MKVNSSYTSPAVRTLPSRRCSNIQAIAIRGPTWLIVNKVSQAQVAPIRAASGAMHSSSSLWAAAAAFAVLAGLAGGRGAGGVRTVCR